MRSERLAAIANVDRGVGGNATAIPQVADVGLQLLGRGRRQDLIGRLPFAADFGLQGPTESRRNNVNSRRIDAMLAPQIAHRRRMNDAADQPEDRCNLDEDVETPHDELLEISADDDKLLAWASRQKLKSNVNPSQSQSATAS